MSVGLNVLVRTQPPGSQFDGLTSDTGIFVETRNLYQSAFLIRRIDIDLGAGAAKTYEVVVETAHGEVPLFVSPAPISNRWVVFSDIKVTIGPDETVKVRTTGCVQRVWAALYCASIFTE